MTTKKDEFYFNACPMEALNQEADRISRLKSTLQGRLNLINLFKSSIDKNYVKLTLQNIGVNTESEFEMTNFMIKNNKDIEYKD